MDKGITFQAEEARACFEEVRPLLESHWQEIAHYKDIPLEPDWKLYAQMEEMGILRSFTIRSESSRELVGYAVFVVKHNPHYSSSMQAIQDILFVRPDFRGLSLGMRFIQWCDEQLRKEGVQVVYHHVKEALNFGPLLQRLGYTKIDTIWGRRLDGEE